MSDPCPSCGREIEPDSEVVWNDEEGIVTRRGHFAVFTRAEMAVLCAIRDALPHAARREFILDRMYLLGADRADKKIVDVMVCRIRPRLEPLQIRIETIWGQAYRLRYD